MTTKPTPRNIDIADLSLDLGNYRTVHQKNEKQAINSLISIHPEWFWALMESLIEDGYIPTENIIVLEMEKSLLVKEGNRRIASLKLIHGLVKDVEIPEHIEKQILNLSSSWKRDNKVVPCAIFSKKNASVADKIVSRIHAKGEASGRDKWTSVARARYARDQKNSTEPALSLLEQYLKSGKNLTPSQAERWAGDYPLTVLDEALNKAAGLLKFKVAINISTAYPKKHKRLLDQICHDIGVSHLGFKQLRSNEVFWGSAYGLTDPETLRDKSNSNSRPDDSNINSNSAINQLQPAKNPSDPAPKSRGKTIALSSQDPKSVRRILRKFKVRGEQREKIVTLINELKTLRIEDHPHAFCFLLRSVFEISAKAYCRDHHKAGGPNAQKKDGNDKSLAVLLADITKHITNNGKDREKGKKIHGAMTELGKHHGVLSVTSLNQLIHNPSFSVTASDICTIFGNLFPLLEEMNS